MDSANFTASQMCTRISNVHHACNKRAYASFGRMLIRFIVSVSKIIKTCLSLCDQSPPHPPLCKKIPQTTCLLQTPKEYGTLNIRAENTADQYAWILHYIPLGI